MSDLERLLDVQAHDTHTDQLRHRRATLPDRERVAAAEADVAKIDQDVARLDSERGELTRTQKRREDEIGSFDERIASVDRTLYGGAVRNPRELQAMQDDLESMRRRRSSIEDEVLELLDQIEPLQKELDRLGTQRATVTQQLDVANDTLVAAEAEIDAQLASVDAERAASVDGLPAELLAEYERLRSVRSGIGVARLVGNRCDGCHLTLSAVELDRIRRADPSELIYCEDCGRLLVH
jgi:predicted  nucleic acid-binding Zn-ribbon protein